MFKNQIATHAVKGETALVIEELKKQDLSPDFHIEHLDSFTTLMCIATANYNIDLIIKLIELGADINLADGLGRTSLLIAIHDGKFDIVKELLELGADLDYFPGGVTPLGTALACDEHEIASFILEKGADPNVRSKEGSPMYIATKCCPTMLVDLTRKGGKFSENELDPQSDSTDSEYESYNGSCDETES